MRNLIESLFDLLFPIAADKLSKEKNFVDETYSEKVAILILVFIVIVFGYFTIS